MNLVSRPGRHRDADRDERSVGHVEATFNYKTLRLSYGALCTGLRTTWNDNPLCIPQRNRCAVHAVLVLGSGRRGRGEHPSPL